MSLKLNKILILILIFSFSCSSSKKLTETKKKTETNIKTQETGTVESKRKGDSIRFEVPNVKFKDTTIIIPSYRNEGSELHVIYDNEGRQKIKCLEGDISEIKTYIIESEENRKEDLKQRDKEKESILNGALILYIFLGLAFLVIVNKVSNKFI